MIMMAKWYSGNLGPKASRHFSYRWEKTPKKTHPGNLSRPGIEPVPAAWQARMLPPGPQRWTLIWSRTLMELIFNPWGEFLWSPEGPVIQIYSHHLHAGSPGIFADLLGSILMLKSEWNAKSNRKLPHLFIHSRTATLVPEFAVEDLSLGRTEALVPENLPLGRTLGRRMRLS